MLSHPFLHGAHALVRISLPSPGRMWSLVVLTQSLRVVPGCRCGSTILGGPLWGRRVLGQLLVLHVCAWSAASSTGVCVSLLARARHSVCLVWK